ncbi:MAG: sigma-54-dependent Fis family transcriptional regulator, partial [Spirochaetes bacterium]|nr:sigma-54-dependent Fis family transcriptional regulator [Spirochaetota bacterium]
AVPPLRERREDIPLLIDYFIDEAVKETEKKRPPVLPDLYTVFKNYDFPGNIRELKSMIFDAVSRSRGDKISLDLFKTIIGKRGGKKGISIYKDSTESTIIFTDRLPTLKDVTKLVIEEALNRSKNQVAAAKLLGISPAALSKRIKAAKNQ